MQSCREKKNSENYWLSNDLVFRRDGVVVLLPEFLQLLLFVVLEDESLQQSLVATDLYLFFSIRVAAIRILLNHENKTDLRSAEKR